MDHEEVGLYWNGNAEVWAKLARAGYDVYRDHFKTPAFFTLLPDVTGLAGLDIGCGTEWLFSAAPPEVTAGLPKFRSPRFTRTLSQWLNLLIDVGFRIDRLAEPRASDETVRNCPALQDAGVVSYFLHIRARKPA